MHPRSAVWNLFIWFLLSSSSFQSLLAAPAAPLPKAKAPVKKLAVGPPKKPGTRVGSDPTPGAGGSTDPQPPPRPATFGLGEFVGVRVKSYETNSKVDTIHPGVVIGGPSGSRVYRVAMISKKLPDNPPQKPITTYQTGTGLEGNVSLLPVDIAWEKMKIWKQKNSGTGVKQPSLTKENLAKLLVDIQNAASGTSGIKAAKKKAPGKAPAKSQPAAVKGRSKSK